MAICWVEISASSASFAWETPNSRWFAGLGVLMVLSLVLAGCPTDGVSDSDSKTLSSLLRVAPSEIQKRDEGEENERDMTVYSFNLEVKDELIQAVEAEFVREDSKDSPKDWDNEKNVLRWCVSPDTEKWPHQIQYFIKGETACHEIYYKPKKQVLTAYPPPPCGQYGRSPAIPARLFCTAAPINFTVKAHEGVVVYKRGMHFIIVKYFLTVFPQTFPHFLYLHHLDYFYSFQIFLSQSKKILCSRIHQ